MSWAVLRKTLRDSRPLLICLTLAVVVFAFLVVRALVEAEDDLAHWRMFLDRPLVKFFIRTALGADLTEDLNSTTLATFALGHPLLYALSWTLLLTIATGVLAAEIGRGTADLLLSLPVSRAAVYLSTSVVWMLAAALVSAAPLAGLWLGERVWAPRQPFDLARIGPVVVNLLALNLCLAAVAMMVSAMVSRRGPAIAVLLFALLASDLVNLLAPFWTVIQKIAFLGFLHYYRPLPVIRSGQVPWADVGILLAVAAVTWLVGLWHFRRRDIPAA